MTLRGVYVAYPIDQRGPASLVHLFQQIEWFKTELLARSLATWCYDPGDAFTVRTDARPDRGLAITNRAALNNSDLVVAFLPKGVPSVGVPMEIDRANAQGKNLIVISDFDSWMIDFPRAVKCDGWEKEQLEALLEQVIPHMDVPDPSPAYHELAVKVLGEGGVLPSRGYNDDAGFDLYVAEDTLIPAGEFVDVPFNIAVQMPPGMWGLITGRSSTFRKKGLHVTNGIIDTGYTGPLFAGIHNPRREGGVWIEKGERIAQLILHYNSTARTNVTRVDRLMETSRGSNGFGSTGA